ncbi:FAD-dependent monooxygenase [Actinomycetospora sp. C-140]
MSTDILVAGAGPTGLALALHARSHGARVRIVDPRTGRRPSRALVVHPRTLEQLRPLGVVEALRARSLDDPRAVLHLGDRTVRVRLEELAVSGGPCGRPLMIRQQEVEDVLAEALDGRGVAVERGVALDGLDPAPEDRARVRLRGAVDDGATESRWVVGCDGVTSTVRSLAGIGEDARPYRQEILLADVDLATGLEPGAVHVAAARAGVVFAFGLGEQAPWRLLATRPAARAGTAAPPGRAELQHHLDVAGLAARVDDVAWSDRLRLARRQARHFRAGPVFLAGDAAHGHSPAGAQGMNVGLQDAAALGWRLAFAGTARRPGELLDSYGAERGRVARASAAWTDAVFWAESSPSVLAGALRGGLAPLAAPVLPALLRRRGLTAPARHLVAGLWVRHRGSAVSRDEAPGPRGTRPGDRLPDAVVETEQGRVGLAALTATPAVHVLLGRDAPAPPPLGPRVAVHRLRDRPDGLLVAVRPDGHVGFRGRDPARLMQWLADLGALPAGEVGPGPSGPSAPGRRPPAGEP